MSRHPWHNLAGLWRADLFSPKDFVRRAVVLLLIFLAVHLAGLREYTSFLNGTMASVALGRGMSAFLGLLYVFAYLGVVLLAPILVLVAALLGGWRKFLRRRAAVATGPETRA